MIIRKVIKSNYTNISNSILQNKNLSLKAKGLLSLCLSLPDNWDFNKKGIMSFSTDGRDSIESAIKELKKYKYLEINKISTTNGKFEYEWVVYEEPYTGNQQPNTGLPNTVLPNTENQHLQITNIQINNKQNIVSKKEAETMTYNQIINSYFKDKEIQNIMLEYVKMRKLIKKPLTNYALTLACKKLIKDFKQEEWIKVVEQSIMNNWQGLFPLKNYTSQELKDKTREAYIKDVEMRAEKNKNNLQKTDEMFKRAKEFMNFLGGKDDNNRSKLVNQDNKSLLPDKKDTG